MTAHALCDVRQTSHEDREASLHLDVGQASHPGADDAGQKLATSEWRIVPTLPTHVCAAAAQEAAIPSCHTCRTRTC
jgi:hypothetical protein